MEAGLRRLITTGEGAQLEFKSSLRHDFKTGKVNKDLTKVAAKTIAGFLNAQGGTLLIGVQDDGKIVGLERDIASLSRKSTDGFELALRTALGLYLGVEISPEVAVAFVLTGKKDVALVSCRPHPTPVFFKDGARFEFYVRDGNSTRPLNVKESHAYIANHFSGDPVRNVVREVLREEGGILFPLPEAERRSRWSKVMFRRVMALFRKASDLDSPPSTVPVKVLPSKRHDEDIAHLHRTPWWLQVTTRRVIDLFLKTLAQSVGWKRIFIISPWISEVNELASITFDSFLRRLQDDRTTVYIVTQPPVHEWHKQALSRFGQTRRANIALVPDLHVKLYVALTSRGSFALIGSANFTQQSLRQVEIGLLINAYSDGKKVVADLNYEAAQIYRTPGRQLLYKAAFD